MRGILIYILFILAINFSCNSQEMTKDGMKYTLIAKLKQNYKHDCDCQSRIVSNKMFDFKVIDINMKDYYLNSINIIVPCAEGYGEDFFIKGGIYKIEFYDNCTNMSIDEGICDYEISRRKRMNRRFWVYSIEKVGNMP